MRVPSVVSDKDAKVTTLPAFVVVCSDCGVVSWGEREDKLREAGIEREHKKYHERTAQHAHEVLERVRRSANSRKKMASDDMCQCPCMDHDGCDSANRDTAFIPPKEIAGLPEVMRICQPCTDYWQERVEQLTQAVVEAADASEDDDPGELRTAHEWNDRDESQKILDWDGFEDLRVTDKISHAEFVERRQRSTCKFKTDEWKEDA